MPEVKGSMARYDLNNDEDLAVLVDRGLVWTGGPKTVQHALRAIVDGRVPRPTRNVPPEVDAYLDKLGVARPVEQSEDVVGPPAEPAPLDEPKL